MIRSLTDESCICIAVTILSLKSLMSNLRSISVVVLSQVVASRTQSKSKGYISSLTVQGESQRDSFPGLSLYVSHTQKS